MKVADFKEASTILANEELKNQFDSINLKLNESKLSFLKLIQPHFGIKENLIENEISNIFKSNLFTILERIEVQVNEVVEPVYTNIVYSEVFNDKVIKFLESKDFKLKIKEYIDVFDKLVNENDTLFMKGTFNHYNADVVTKSLKDNKFFSAKHKVKIKDQEIDTINQLEELIKTEKDKVLKDPELTSKFNEIDKSLNSNTELRNFRTYIENNQEIIKEFFDLKNFSKKLVVNYLAAIKDEFNVLLKLYKETNNQRNSIIEEAKKDWEKVLKIFKSRFSVPFEVRIKNQEDVILKKDPASPHWFKSSEGRLKSLP